MHRFLIDEATIDLLPSILIDDAPCIRIAGHYPSAVFDWWQTRVPLSHGGEPRAVMVRALEFDLELSTSDFLAWRGDFADCGLHLVQSDTPLPAMLDRRRFRGEGSYLKALAGCGARLLFELPHPRETAGITLFGDADADRFRESGLGRPDPDAGDSPGK